MGDANGSSVDAVDSGSPRRWAVFGHVLGAFKLGFFAYVFLELFGQESGRMVNGRCVCPLCMALNVVPPQIQTPVALPPETAGDAPSQASPMVYAS